MKRIGVTTLRIAYGTEVRRGTVHALQVQEVPRRVRRGRTPAKTKMRTKNGNNNNKEEENECGTVSFIRVRGWLIVGST